MQQIAITVDGASISLECCWIGSEEPDSPLLVFLHEGLGSAAQWGDWPRALCAALGWRGLVFSRYGYGHSQARPASSAGDGWPLDYMEREARLYLPALFTALGIDAARERALDVGRVRALGCAAGHRGHCLPAAGDPGQAGPVRHLGATRRDRPPRGRRELLVVEQCRHVPHEEHPDTVLRAIRAFLSALPPPDKLPT